MSDVDVVLGVIRGDRVVLEFAAHVPADDQLLLRAVGPSDIRETAVETVGGPDGRRRADVGLEQLPSPLRAIKLFRRGEAGEASLSTGRDYHLLRLLPLDEGEYVSTFTWESQRIKDPETLRFAAQQVVRHSNFPASRIAAAASIVAYRSIDFDDKDGCHLSLRFIDDAIGRIDELEDTADATEPANVRTDRTHLAVSLYTVRWHLCLYLGDFDEVMRSLEAGYEIVLPVTDAWSIGYNGSKLTLLYGFMLWKSGHIDRAIEVFDFAFILFQRVAASAHNDNSTLFNDHRAAHRAAFVSMLAKEAIRGIGDTRAAALQVEAIGEEVFRVRERDARTLLHRRLTEMVEARQTSDIARAAAAMQNDREAARGLAAGGAFEEAGHAWARVASHVGGPALLPTGQLIEWATALRRAGDPAQALELLLPRREREGDRRPVQRAAADAATAADENELAAELWRELAEETSEGRAHLMLAKMLVRLRRYDEARDAIDAGLERSPRSSNLISMRAADLIRRGDREGALALLQEYERATLNLDRQGLQLIEKLTRPARVKGA